MTTTVHVAIGNTDNKLTQQEWHEFALAVDAVVTDRAKQVHGAFFTGPAEPYQSGCWAFEPYPRVRHRKVFQQELAALAEKYRQDSIAWTEGETEFITPPVEPKPKGTIKVGSRVIVRRHPDVSSHFVGLVGTVASDSGSENHPLTVEFDTPPISDLEPDHGGVWQRQTLLLVEESS